jgi:hypothetical protein
MRQQDRRWLTGDLDEFSVWNRVLDEKEVRQLY